MNWKPIETAPKDRRILLCYPDSPFTNCNVQIGRWDVDAYTAKPKPHFCVDQDRIWGARTMKTLHPTHWAELVAP
jgi:hypothetical protein